MNGWIICNGALSVSKIDKLIEKLHKKATEKKMKISVVKNNEIISFYNENSKPDLLLPNHLTLPDYVIFWDKDVMLARHLEKMGIRLFNSASAIELCDNKSLMHNHLAGRNIKMPKTVQAPFSFFEQNLDYDYYKNITSVLGNELVIKESLGSFGMQVYKANSYEEFLEIVNQIGNKSFIIQEFISSSFGKDIRVNIVGDKIIGAVMRVGQEDFRANITLGATATPCNLTKEQSELALKAHKILGTDFSGVDLLFDKDGSPILCEVNSNVNFLSFEVATGIDFASEILDYVLICMSR